mmetsp:Transcript_71650/g.171084  ORF Transcript_71650/g.171084 Transcript_71650/m.171084 type:complete len:214 (-) Transcript_71650:115-756(-)
MFRNLKHGRRRSSARKKCHQQLKSYNPVFLHLVFGLTGSFRSNSLLPNQRGHDSIHHLRGFGVLKIGAVNGEAVVKQGSHDGIRNSLTERSKTILWRLPQLLREGHVGSLVGLLASLCVASSRRGCRQRCEEVGQNKQGICEDGLGFFCEGVCLLGKLSLDGIHAVQNEGIEIVGTSGQACSKGLSPWLVLQLFLEVCKVHQLLPKLRCNSST